MSRYLIANYKMNFTAGEVSRYLKTIKGKIKSKQVVLCPSSIYIPYFLNQEYEVGIQNTFMRSKGAYTGEISPKQAMSMGISYVILGHSERRMYLNEIDDFINKKVLEALKFGMKIILCIGETKEQRNLLKTDRVLKRQITSGLRYVKKEQLNQVLIAYEPTWLEEGNLKQSIKEIEETILYIKSIIQQQFEVDIPILYGGNVTLKNSADLLKKECIGGFLVGESSLDPEQFLKLVEVVVSQ